MPKLCIFDASGYLHRAYHALPLLTTSQGQPINAIYGFSRMISKVLKSEKPDLIGVCFDTPAPTFRHKEFSDYKATREAPEDNLISQLPLAEELAQAWGLPCLKKEGYEADDLIATLTAFGVKHGYQVLILSGDKDILQLVAENVHVRDEVRDVEYDAAKVQERYGISVDQLTDYFCLMGDKVDNVPGVPGVGAKTAAKLILEYGNLENLFSKIQESPLPIKEKILTHRETVMRNRSLIRLKEDVPVDLSVESLTMRPYDPAALAALMQRLEFKQELYGVSGVSQESSWQTNATRTVRVVLTAAELDALTKTLGTAGLLAYDLETDGLNSRTCSIVGVSLSCKENEAWYIPIAHRYLGAPEQLPWEKVRTALKPFLESPRLKKAGQNVKFDNKILERFGIQVADPCFDTMIAAYCLDPARSSYSLKEMAGSILGERMTRIQELIGDSKDGNFSDVTIEQASLYAGADSEVVIRLTALFSKQLDEAHLWDLFNQFEMPLVKVIQAMESAGLAVDVEYLAGVGKQLSEERRGLESEIHALAGEPFLINSPKQLGHILFEKLKLPVVKKTKTGYSTDEEVLTRLAQQHPICEKMIAYRELAKLISTYVDSLLEQADPVSHRVHTSFNQTGTATGRLSSSDPNLQNIPIRSEHGRRIRKAFVASQGNVLLSADYSQIDLRALAHMSEDPLLIKTFEAGGDVHRSTASAVFHAPPDHVTEEMRRRAKAINFGIVYGQQAYGLSQGLGIPMEEAQAFIKAYFEKYAGVRVWIDRTLEVARQTGWVSTLAGRRRQVKDITSKNGSLRGFAERIAINTPIQGSSADIIKAAMINVYHELVEKALKTRMLVQVHDELLFDVPNDELDVVVELVRRGMESAFPLRVPLVVDLKIGANWNDMKKMAREVPV